MLLKRWLALLSLTGSVGVVAYGGGCSSTGANQPGVDSGVPDDATLGDSTQTDTGLTMDDAVAEGSSMDGPPVDAGPGCSPVVMPNGCCNASETFYPVPWAPPQPQMSWCTQAQAQGLYDSCFSGSASLPACTNYQNDPMNVNCLNCAYTDVSQSTHGPFVEMAGPGGGSYTIETNVGGCIALIDGDTSPTSCGAKIDAQQDCLDNDCFGCRDKPTHGPMFQACIMNADAVGGSCSNYAVPPSCLNELVGNMVPGNVCKSVVGIIMEFCGASPADAGGGG